MGLIFDSFRNNVLQDIKKCLKDIHCKDLSNFTNLTKKFKTVNTLTKLQALNSLRKGEPSREP